jgi:carbon storage regulator CsrA
VLVLTRKTNEDITITHLPTGDQIIIKYIENDRGRIRLGFLAEREIFEVMRSEVIWRDKKDE